jgi:hypothetical protein
VAQDTLVGIELMPMSKKRPLVVEEEDEGRTAAELFYSLAASSMPQTGVSTPSRPPEQNLRHNPQLPAALQAKALLPSRHIVDTGYLDLVWLGSMCSMS